PRLEIPDELEELPFEPVGNLVELVHHRFGKPREHFHQRDAGIVSIKVGPLRSVARDQRQGFLGQVLPTPVIEIGEGQRHSDQTFGGPSMTMSIGPAATSRSGGTATKSPDGMRSSSNSNWRT